VSPPSPAPLVAGVDGCPGGWVVATLTARADPGASSTVEVVPTIDEVIERVHSGALTLVGLDLPVGLPDAGPRACDVEARRRLGPRHSSVFPAPVRPVLATTTYPDALAVHRAADGRGLSKQAWHLLPKLREVDAAMTPALQDRIVEAHPELAFARLAGAPLTTVKRRADGRAERLALLRPHAPDAGAHLAPVPRGARADDVLDALALAVLMRDHHRGRATVLGDGARDGRGLAMAIVG
jgi:predicted RNase H-like nuclease